MQEDTYVVPAYGTKVCPQCGQTLFDDMEVCYGCLHEFGDGKSPGSSMEQAAVEDAGEREDTQAYAGMGARGAMAEEEVPTEAYERGWVAVEGDRVAMDAGEVPPQLWVRVCSGDMEACVPMGEDGLLVGRGPSCDVVLHMRSVSRRHVRIVPDGEGVLVQNQGATNQAKLAGKKVGGKARMEVGDELDVCGATFTLVKR